MWCILGISEANSAYLSAAGVCVCKGANTGVIFGHIFQNENAGLEGEVTCLDELKKDTKEQNGIMGILGSQETASLELEISFLKWLTFNAIFTSIDNWEWVANSV